VFPTEARRWCRPRPAVSTALETENGSIALKNARKVLTHNENHLSLENSRKNIEKKHVQITTSSSF